ncbi:MAG: GNAT family N-acetyltransferase [Anaerolineaceae bacterium]|nr:GNAT family N-acetyltransferase [Anaerolineaceae bacterium]
MDNMTSNTTEYTLRAITLDDAQEVVDLLNTCSMAIKGEPYTNLQDTLTRWSSPGFDINTCIRVLSDPDGRIIGYAHLLDTEDPYVAKHCMFNLHPEFWDDTLAHRLLDWAISTAQARISLAPQGARVILAETILNIDTNRQRILTQKGFHLERIFQRMVVELDQEPAQPSFPQGLKVRPIDYSTEFRDAILVMHEAFKDHWGVIPSTEEQTLAFWKHRLDNDPDFDPDLWFLALDDEQIIGVCMCNPKTLEDPHLGWVGELAVQRNWRKKGLGLAFLQHSFCELYARGQRKVGLLVDSDSLTGASKLYATAGMHVTRQYDIYHKELRPGKDLSTQEI